MKLKLPRLANTNSKKQPEKKKRELNNDLLIQIVAELAVIRKIKERSLREQSKPKQAAVVKKPAITIAKKATAVPKAVKPVKQESIKQESIKQPTPEIKAPVAAAGITGIAAGLLLFPSFKETVVSTLKQTIDLTTGILSEPIKDFVKLFTTSDTIEKTKQVQDNISTIDAEIGNNASEFSQDEKVIQEGSSKLEKDLVNVDKVNDVIEKHKQEQKVETKPVETPAPTPVSTPAPKPVVAEEKPKPAETAAKTEPTPAVSKPAVPVEQPPVAEIKKPPSSSFQQGKKGVLNALTAEGITDPVARAQILAQTAHESGGFKYTQEIGDVSYFQKYEGRKDLGNIYPGDGVRFIGRGFLQTTGRTNYQQFKDEFGVDVINNPETLAEPQYAAKSALFWFKKNAKKVERLSGGDWSNTEGVTRAVNGGLNGLKERLAYFESFVNDPDVVGPRALQAPTTQGTTLAQASEQVIASKKETEVRKRTRVKNILVAQHQRTIIPA